MVGGMAGPCGFRRNALGVPLRLRRGANYPHAIPDGRHQQELREKRALVLEVNPEELLECRCGTHWRSRYEEIWRDGTKYIRAEKPCPTCHNPWRIAKVHKSD